MWEAVPSFQLHQMGFGITGAVCNVTKFEAGALALFGQLSDE
jgi:hypothetical protein